MGHQACRLRMECEDTVAVDDVVLGLIKFGPLWFRVYRITTKDGKFMLHGVARGAYDALHAVEPEDGRLYYEVVDGDGAHMFHGYQPDGIFDEGRRCERSLADLWMEFPLHITEIIA